MNTDIQLTKNFNLQEFLHPGAEKELTAGIIENLRKLAQRLQVLRDKLGKPIKITSGFRTRLHNEAIGRAKNSQHLYGRAADIVVDGMNPAQLKEAIGDWNGGLGYYPDKPRRKGWIHLDIWNDRNWID